jgi:hypothetical protein
MTGRKPERPKGGWKVHEKQLQDLWDWINKERILDGPGIQNTGNGKRIVWRADKFNPMFEPFFNRESKYIIKMGIRPGYVYAPYDDGNSTHLPMLHRFPFEPKIGTNALSSTPSPKLTLEGSATNYIYLKLTWGYFEDEIGGEPFGGNHAFKAEYGLEVFDTQDGYYYAVQDSSQGSGSYTQGIYTPIKKRTYYLTDAEFISQTSDTPPTETETETNMLAGWLKLDANGDLDTSTNEGSRWFLQGPIYTNKSPAYISNVSGQSASHRTEPVAPVASSGESIPGA